MHDEESTARHAVDPAPQSRTWLWASVLAVAMLVAAALLYIFVVREREATAKEPPATIVETRTARPPTPSITPSPREPGTAFYDRLPSTVGAYVFTAVAANPDWEQAGAFDSYTVTYSDGEHQITLLAAQWRTPEAAKENFDAFGGAEAWPGPDIDLTSTDCPESPEPDTKALWVNQTAVFQVDAPDGGAREFYCGMPM
ncbi:MAG: hypothetical protein LBD77_11375 [Bifidobacteriaceae bacterium]|jgi:hypothetical protein|nr:hypothetical protein [Bifidobacteriaceae bacterium]